MNSENKLKFDGWFSYYMGMIYGNVPTSVNDKINNKALINCPCVVRPNRPKNIDNQQHTKTSK